MLSKILSKSDCASCRFCCSFRRTSLWETPLFTKEAARKLAEQFPAARFRPAGKNAVTIDLSGSYKTDDPAEEAPCPFLDTHSGCLLSPQQKPFDCSIWPLRAVRRNADVIVALTPTCPAVNRVPIDDVRALAESDLGKQILLRAEAFPDMVKDDRDFFVPVYTGDGTNG